MSRRFCVNGDNSGQGDNAASGRREKVNSKRKKRKRKPPLDDDDNDDDDDGCIYKRGLKRAKKAVFFPFNKFHKLFKRSSSSSNSSFPINDNNSRKDGGYFCCLCMSKKPQTVDISSDEIDPNHPKVSYEYLKCLLEKNDFYSKECNTHLVD